MMANIGNSKQNFYFKCIYLQNYIHCLYSINYQIPVIFGIFQQTLCFHIFYDHKKFFAYHVLHFYLFLCIFLYRQS